MALSRPGKRGKPGMPAPQSAGAVGSWGRLRGESSERASMQCLDLLGRCLGTHRARWPVPGSPDSMALHPPQRIVMLSDRGSRSECVESHRGFLAPLSRRQRNKTGPSTKELASPLPTLQRLECKDFILPGSGHQVIRSSGHCPSTARTLNDAA